MNSDDVIKNFRDYHFQVPLNDLPLVVFENLRLNAELLALRKYTARQFLGLNGGDEVLEIDEEKKILLDKEYEVMKEYYDEIFQDLFLDFVSKYGTPGKNDLNIGG
jgi:hypothetical protein